MALTARPALRLAAPAPARKEPPSPAVLKIAAAIGRMLAAQDVAAAEAKKETTDDGQTR